MYIKSLYEYRHFLKGNTQLTRIQIKNLIWFYPSLLCIKHAFQFISFGLLKSLPCKHIFLQQNHTNLDLGQQCKETEGVVGTDPGKRGVFSTLQNCVPSIQVIVCLRGAQAVVRGKFLLPASPPPSLPRVLGSCRVALRRDWMEGIVLTPECFSPLACVSFPPVNRTIRESVHWELVLCSG